MRSAFLGVLPGLGAGAPGVRLVETRRVWSVPGEPSTAGVGPRGPRVVQLAGSSGREFSRVTRDRPGLGTRLLAPGLELVSIGRASFVAECYPTSAPALPEGLAAWASPVLELTLWK